MEASLLRPGPRLTPSPSRRSCFFSQRRHAPLLPQKWVLFNHLREVTLATSEPLYVYTVRAAEKDIETLNLTPSKLGFFADPCTAVSLYVEGVGLETLKRTIAQDQAGLGCQVAVSRRAERVLCRRRPPHAHLTSYSNRRDVQAQSAQHFGEPRNWDERDDVLAKRCLAPPCCCLAPWLCLRGPKRRCRQSRISPVILRELGPAPHTSATRSMDTERPSRSTMPASIQRILLSRLELVRSIDAPLATLYWKDIASTPRYDPMCREIKHLQFMIWGRNERTLTAYVNQEKSHVPTRVNQGNQKTSKSSNSKCPWIRDRTPPCTSVFLGGASLPARSRHSHE